jgi:hypothetical protein
MTNTGLLETLPDALKEIKLRPLLTMRLAVAEPSLFGRGPDLDRRVAVVTGGRFESRDDGLRGRVQSGGSDWQTLRSDNTTTLDVRLVLETEGGDLIGMTYKGLRHGPPETLARLARGENVDPSEYYFRLVPFFETASERFAWLNGILAVATGHRFPDGPIYNVFEIL